MDHVVTELWKPVTAEGSGYYPKVPLLLDDSVVINIAEVSQFRLAHADSSNSSHLASERQSHQHHRRYPGRHVQSLHPDRRRQQLLASLAAHLRRQASRRFI